MSKHLHAVNFDGTTFGMEIMSDEKFYYKIINNQTNEVDFVVCTDAEANPEMLCDFLCLNGYRAVETTKEEYEKFESEE